LLTWRRTRLPTAAGIQDRQHPLLPGKPAEDEIIGFDQDTVFVITGPGSGKVDDAFFFSGVEKPYG
jgi:hypothetical protein